MKILPTLAISANDCVQAEKLLDFLALMKGKKPSGCIVLSFAADLHEEMRVRIKIAAEIGFEIVDVFACPKLEGHKGKVEQVNHLFAKTAQHVGANYRLPFLWLEPDVTPMCADWLARLERAYDEQPKLYMGSILSDAHKNRCIGRVGVYPRGCSQDIRSVLEGKIPFEIAAGEGLVARTTRTKLIQMLPILMPEDRERVRSDAVLVHGDKAGILLSALMDEGAQLASMLEEQKTAAQTITGSNAQAMGAEMPVRINVSHNHDSGAAILSPERLMQAMENVSSPNGVQPTTNSAPTDNSLVVPTKIDGRTRAARQAKAAQSKTL